MPCRTQRGYSLTEVLAIPAAFLALVLLAGGVTWFIEHPRHVKQAAATALVQAHRNRLLATPANPVAPRVSQALVDTWIDCVPATVEHIVFEKASNLSRAAFIATPVETWVSRAEMTCADQVLNTVALGQGNAAAQAIAIEYDRLGVPVRPVTSDADVALQLNQVRWGSPALVAR
jgi:hypothetical protein